tara:strand:- start:629 stop:1078 length:450 start_codon:yes stop_codon:yes gene_type:complete
LQRVRELTVQAQNGTNSADDLTSIQNEIGQRLNEINRISEETSFNGVKVLASDQGLQIQVGANDGEAISVNLNEITAGTLGLEGQANSLAGANDVTAQGFVESTSVAGQYTNNSFNAEAVIRITLNTHIMLTQIHLLMMKQLPLLTVLV